MSLLLIEFICDIYYNNILDKIPDTYFLASLCDVLFRFSLSDLSREKQERQKSRDRDISEQQRETAHTADSDTQQTRSILKELLYGVQQEGQLEGIINLDSISLHRVIKNSLGRKAT